MKAEDAVRPSAPGAAGSDEVTRRLAAWSDLGSRFTRRILILAVAALPLAACGGPEPAPANAPGAAAPGGDSSTVQPDQTGESSPPPDQDIGRLDACTILPASDITRVIGKLEEQRSGGDVPGRSSCVFDGTRSNPGTRIVERHEVVIVVTERSEYELEKKLLTRQPLAGFGDDAFVNEQPSIDNDVVTYRVWAAKGGRAVCVTGIKEDQDGVLSLARAVLAKL